ncbi:MAG TPA: hypothetical protein VK829_19180, partial [Terriglobales bacterium]|nr:hypothetical protein [Terriglobales bacterium]
LLVGADGAEPIVVWNAFVLLRLSALTSIFPLVVTSTLPSRIASLPAVMVQATGTRCVSVAASSP